jgi:phospholipid N-methyltransferase
MKPFNLFFSAVMIFSLFVLSPDLYSQEKVRNDNYTPHVGQEGKDVVWVPTPQALVEKMLDLAKITREDFLIDLGSGDGRTVVTAAKRGTAALGIEYNPDMVALSRAYAEAQGVSDKARFIEADLFETDLSPATVITMFLLPDINLRLRPKLLDLKPGTRVVSNTFTMKDWHFDDSVKTSETNVRWNTAFLWIVPARVEGIWKTTDGELTLTQVFQMISGTLKKGLKTEDITAGRLRGNVITYTAGSEIYTGIVEGNIIEGKMTSNGISTKWSAFRQD